jgi:hypothetical protein
MTAVPDFDVFGAPAVAGWVRREPRETVVTATYWGYRVEGLRAPLWLVGMQGLCWIVGVVLTVVALGLWAVPGAGGAASLAAFKLGASVPMLGVAALLLWHSSRGTRMGVEVDLRLGEVREVLSNRADRTTVLARYGFDAIGGVHLVRGNGPSTLVLRYRNTAQVLRVAVGHEADLAGLRDRLGRDLMVGKRRRVIDAAEAEETLTAAA